MLVIHLLRFVFSGVFTAWAVMRRRSFWSESWIALFRVHKDGRARKQILLALYCFISVGVVAGSVLVLGLLFRYANDASKAVLMDRLTSGLFWLFCAYLVLRMLVSFGAKRVQVVPDSSRTWADERLYKPGIRKELADYTLACAVLASRAASEGFLAEKVVPEGVEVVTRRNHVALLRESDLWDRMGSEEKHLLMRPDGGWEPGAADRVGNELLDRLRMLRWVLRVDFYLPVPGKDLKRSHATAYELLAEPRRWREGYDLIRRADLEAARHSALGYFQRGAAEGVTRGYFAAESDENLAWSRKVTEELAGKQGEDWLVGGKIMSEVDEATVRRVTALALGRVRVCDWLVRVISGKELLGQTFRLLNG